MKKRNGRMAEYFKLETIYTGWLLNTEKQKHYPEKLSGK